MITNSINNKKYIGQTRQNVYKRWKAHVRGSDIPLSSISKAIQKYGYENFEFSVLEKNIDISDLDSREIFWIDKYNTTVKKYGYNMNTGGGVGFTASDETKMKQSIAGKNRDPQIYKNHSEFMKLRYKNNPIFREDMAKVAIKTHTGRKQDSEWVNKRADAHRGYVFKEEQKIKLARAHMNGRKIQCSNGEIYLSAYEASLCTGALQSHIGSICNGKRKSSNGYTFQYVDTEVGDSDFGI